MNSDVEKVLATSKLLTEFPEPIGSAMSLY
jgi:hypothetical protein